MQMMQCHNLAIIATFLAMQTTSVGQTQHVQGRSFQQWGILILENVDYSDAQADPTFQKIHNYGNNRLLSQYYAIDHPSLPNYLASIAGTTFGIKDDDAPDAHSFTETTILDLLEAKNISWKMYAEDYGGGCLDAVANSASDLFGVKHVPALYSERITATSGLCDHVVEASEFQTDLDNGALPQWWYYVPNLKNDGHDTDLSYMASYLNTKWVPRFENKTFTNDLAMVMTFDESENSGGLNHIYAALIGDAVQPTSGGHEDTTRYDHYSLIRTVEDNWDLGTLGRNDSKATVISTGAQSTNNPSSTTRSSNDPAKTSSNTAVKNTILSIEHKSGGKMIATGLGALCLLLCTRIAF
jgi:Phosphoesterase family